MIEIEIDYSPRSAFLPLHNRKQRWAAVVAHRRAGKTVACVNELIKGSVCFPGHDGRFAYVAPFYKQAKSVAWDYLKWFSRSIPNIAINESELRIDYPNGSRVQLFGADHADALRGQYFDGLVGDEFGDWRPSVWEYVIRPALSDRKGWAIIIGTAKGRNEFHDKIKKATNDPNWLVLTIKAATSGILSPDEMISLKQDLSEDAWRQEMECDFDAALPGAIYGKEMFEARQNGRICEVPHDAAVPVYTAWDLGLTDDTGIWWYQVIQSEIHVLEYLGDSGLLMEDYFKHIKSRPYKYGMHFLPHDARAKTLASGGKSIEEMTWAALGRDKVRIVPSLSVQDGIQAARALLKTCWFDQKKCELGIDSLVQYQREWDETKKCFSQKPRHDWTSHAADAWRMLALSVKYELAPEKPKEVRFPINQTFDELVAQNKRERLG